MLKSSKLKIMLITIILVNIVVLSGCSIFKKSNKTMARWDENVFVSEWAGFKMQLPDGWQIATDEEIKEVMSLSADMLVGVTDIDADDLKYADALYPMYISEYPLGYGAINTNMILHFQKLSALDNIIIDNADDYLTMVKEQLDEVDLGYVAEMGQARVIAGEEYATMNTAIEVMPGLTIIQRYYSRMYDGYIISILVTGDTNEPEKLDSLINSIKKIN